MNLIYLSDRLSFYELLLIFIILKEHFKEENESRISRTDTHFPGIHLTCSWNSPLRACTGCVSSHQTPENWPKRDHKSQRERVEAVRQRLVSNKKTSSHARPGARVGGRLLARHPHVSCQHPLSRWPSPAVVPSDPDKALDPSLTAEVHTEESHAWLKSKSLPTSHYPGCSQFEQGSAPPLLDPRDLRSDFPLKIFHQPQT